MKNNIMNNSFFKSILTLASGSVLAQIISFAVSPLMTRLYSTEEIGLYTLIITAVSMFGGVICGRYDMSIVTVKKEEEVFSLVKLSFFICLITSILISIGYLIYYYSFDKMDVSFVLIFTLIFILLFTNGIGNILISFNNRNKEYSLMTSVHVIRTFAKELTMVILGFLNVGSMGLMISQIIGQVFGLKRQSRSLKKFLSQILAVNKTEMFSVAKLHYKQPLYSVPAIFANSFSYSSINLFIVSLYGLTTLGYYALSFRILGMPLSIISNNVSRVFFEEASKEYNKSNQYKKTFLKTSLLLAIIAIPMVFGMIYLAPLLFEWFFGEGWEIAGHYVSILAPMFGIRFIVSALSPGMIISKKQNLELLINSLFFFVSILVYLFTKLNEIDIYQYLNYISLSYASIYIVHFFILFNYSLKKQDIK